MLDPDPDEMNADPQPCHGLFDYAEVTTSYSSIGRYLQILDLNNPKPSDLKIVMVPERLDK